MQPISQQQDAETELIKSDILAFLAQNEDKELMRFVTVGSVDDGKSTLIGRLLHDTKGVYDDQLKDAIKTTATGEQAIDFARITDGLRAEREQGITIDVAYRYFSTPRRKFIIADTPGHTQYTRNMATGASTANVAIILIDARLGVLQQSRRHAYIADLLGIPHLLVVVNKMDLVDYDQAVYTDILADFKSFSDGLGFRSVDTIPASALMGINIVEPSPHRTPWYEGPTVLQFLETVEISGDQNLDDFRYPVQTVIRPNLDYRGFAGQVVSGIVRPGDRVKVLPNGQESVVKSIDTYGGALDQAYAPQSVTLRLEDEIDVSRGDMLVPVGDDPFVGRHLDAMVVWMSDTPLDTRRSYMIKHTTRYVRTNVDEVAWRIDLESLQHQHQVTELNLNEIGLVRFTTHRPLVFDPYKKNRGTGAFIIIDSMTNVTVGAAMIVEPQDRSALAAGVDLGTETQVSPRERADATGHPGFVVGLVGALGSGRSALAFSLERRLFDRGCVATVLDPRDARYSDIPERAWPAVWPILARRLADAGVITLVSGDMPGIGERTRVADALGEGRFVEVHIATPESLSADRSRDPFASLLQGAAFEAPEDPAVTVSIDGDTVDDAVLAVEAHLVAAGLVPEGEA